MGLQDSRRFLRLMGRVWERMAVNGLSSVKTQILRRKDKQVAEFIRPVRRQRQSQCPNRWG